MWKTRKQLLSVMDKHRMKRKLVKRIALGITLGMNIDYIRRLTELYSV